MSVSLDEVRRIAALAHIGVPDERLPALARELSGILAHMAVLQQVADSGTVTDAGPAQTPWRDDHSPPIPLRRPLDSFAPEVRDGFLIVPRLATHGGHSADHAAARAESGAAPDEPRDPGGLA
jgi:aspartyl-tRNA(Asn)/glutamyl-tRNA(Gln) amidotransferase subunit C